MANRGVQRTQQVRQIKPRKAAPAPPPPPGSALNRRQRERYVQSGGLLQGYAPELVMKVAYASAAASALCLLIMALLLFSPLRPAQVPVRIVAAAVWVIPIAFMASFLLPGIRLAMKDRRAETRLVQGQLVGASAASTSIGLGMIMIKTRGGNEQYLCSPDKLAKVPGNQVNVVLTITPHLRHVRSLGVMGQRLVPRPEPPVPPVLRRLQWLPILTPAVLAAAVIVGATVVAYIPFTNQWIHAVVTVLVAAALGVGAYGMGMLYQRRMMAEVQKLVPGAGIG